MKTRSPFLGLRLPFSAGLAVVLGAVAPAPAAQDVPKPVAATNLSGLHDFDFQVGSWQVKHRRLSARLAGSHDWVEFTGTCVMRPVMDGWGNVEDNVLHPPTGSYKAVALRSYDAQTGTWSIWWLDGRSPHAALDPAVNGRFENGVGTFLAKDTFAGKPILVRFIWSKITPTTAHWEQAFSPDDGKTWEVNWTMEFQRN